MELTEIKPCYKYIIQQGQNKEQNHRKLENEYQYTAKKTRSKFKRPTGAIIEKVNGGPASAYNRYQY
jgi:hypothetical protein